MSYTYTWSDVEQTSLKREDAEGNVCCVPTDPGNRDYAEFLSSGATATPYVEQPAPEEPVSEEKVNRLLSDYGLSREELRSILLAD
tara:strand:+ start:280 stop:537 length:258 start_codon:yes stop_codon:yes gene_type:complete